MTIKIWNMISLERFKEIVESFVIDNFCADGCLECNENGNSIVPDDHKGSYDKAIKQMYDEVLK